MKRVRLQSVLLIVLSLAAVLLCAHYASAPSVSDDPSSPSGSGSLPESDSLPESGNTASDEIKLPEKSPEEAAQEVLDAYGTRFRRTWTQLSCNMWARHSARKRWKNWRDAAVMRTHCGGR